MAIGISKICVFISPHLKENKNLLNTQKVLLKVHEQHSHHSMKEIQQWAREGKYDLPTDIVR